MIYWPKSEFLGTKTVFSAKAVPQYFSNFNHIKYSISPFRKRKNHL